VTILDANITTLIAALVLFQFGTGPVKGFAVTLSIGIIASLFTAIVITRLIFDYLIIERGWRKIRI
jgi:preprotein translocase subunit SecD